jgi:hypothetical protein
MNGDASLLLFRAKNPGGVQTLNFLNHEFRVVVGGLYTVCPSLPTLQDHAMMSDA